MLGRPTMMMHEKINRIDHVSMLSIQDLENKHYNTSAFFIIIMTSSKFSIIEFPDPENVSVLIKIMILCVGYYTPR